MSLFKLPLPKRAHSLFYHRNPYQLNLPNKNNANFHKLEILSNNSPEIKISKDNISKKDEHCNIKSRCSTKVFNGQSFCDNDIPSVILLTSNCNVLNEEISINHIPPLPSPDSSIFKQIFKEKIELCNIIFNFSKANFQLQGKKEKETSLSEINTLLLKKKDASLLEEDDKDLIYQMINKNIFEQDPFISTKKILPISVKSDFVEGSWEHLSIAFKILNQFVLIFPEKCEIDLAKKAIFLLNNPDSNERENLTLFLKNYTKVHPNDFDEIWKILKKALLDVRFNVNTPYCVDPIISYILIICKSNIIKNPMNYIAQILYSHLLPLFNHKYLSLYFENLTNLIKNIVAKRLEDQLNVILYIIKHFPYCCGQKQPLFVQALTKIIISIREKELSEITQPLFSFIAMAIKSPNNKLVESALTFMANQNVRPIILSNYDLVKSILFEPLKEVSTSYWDETIKTQCQNALLNLMSMKFEFIHNNTVNDLLQQSRLHVDLTETAIKKDCKQKSNQELAKNWAILSRTAAKRDSSINLPKTLYRIQIQFLRDEK